MVFKEDLPKKDMLSEYVVFFRRLAEQIKSFEGFWSEKK